MFRSRLLLGLCISLFLVVLTSSAKSTRAASCYGSACNGQDPYSTGCADDAYLVASGDVYNDYNISIGAVFFFWSNTCSAGFTEAESDYESAYRIVAIIGLSSTSYQTTQYNTVSATSPLLSADSSSELSSCANMKINSGAPDPYLYGVGCAQ